MHENDISTDPNTTFRMSLQSLLHATKRHFMDITVRFNKYNNKMNEWISAGILHSIQYGNHL